MGFEVGGSFWMLLASALLLGAGEVLPLVLVASLCHEAAHIAALRLLGARPQRLRLSGLGLELCADTRYMPYGRELLCVLAGPAVNLVLAVALARISGDHLLAGANLLLGVFNLLPIHGLDGGRVLHLAVSWAAGPDAGDRVSAVVGLAAALALSAAALFAVLHGGGGLFLLLGALGLLFPQVALVKRGETR